MTTQDRLNHATKVAEMTERLLTVYHRVLQLNKMVDEQKELFDLQGYFGINKLIRIELAHLRRLEKRYDQLITSYDIR